MTDPGFKILPQPNDTTCGPTCLQAVYDFYNDYVDLNQVISEVIALKDGGTLAVLLANHALRRGYKATIYTYNLEVFDPTWKTLSHDLLADKLAKQMVYKNDKKLRTAIDSYLEFLMLGGNIKFEELSPGLLRSYLKKNIPVLTGLSSTYLYQCPREYGEHCEYDDERGFPCGHFVVLYDYDHENKLVQLADPLLPNPVSETQYYAVPMQRLLNSILLGVITYDANLLIIEKE